MDETKKRKTTTSSAVKYRYNSKNYKQFNVQIKPDLFNRINEYCDKEGITRPQFLARAIDLLFESKFESDVNS